jgi:Capsule assembly protein Wzi
MKSFLLPIPILIIINVSTLFSQTVYEPVGNSVYDFLERLSEKGIIEYHDEVKPVSRKEIAEFLIEAGKDSAMLTGLDKEDLVFYDKEYADDIDLITKRASYKLPSSEFLSSGRTGRLRLFGYRDSSFAMYIDPVMGIEAGSEYGASYTHRWNGLSMFGYAGDHWGFSLKYVDNEEIGDHIDTTRAFSPQPGFVLTAHRKTSIEYDEVEGEVDYTWKTGAISIGKYAINWGSGNSGQLIFSSKAPTFPLIRFGYSPVSWLKFTYFHGWLKSNVIDSSSIRQTAVPGRVNIDQVPKFIAAHMLTIYPSDKFSFSIGESMVYSDEFNPVYLIPVIFFRAVDHYMSSRNSNSSTGNAQMFSNMEYKNPDLRTKLYGTLFIDELSLESIFKGGNLSAIAFTIGMENTDPIIKNSSFVIEYTRINPFVYMNSNNAQLYTNDRYQLGDWIGSNGYQAYASYNQEFIRGLWLKLSGDYIIKGQTELPQQQYETPYPPILYGPQKHYQDYKVELSYQVIHELFASAYYQHYHITDQEPGRTPQFMLGSSNAFGASVGYGF